MGLAIAMTFSLALLAIWVVPQAMHDLEESKVGPTNKGA
jgi:hypothetical protein